MFIYVIFFENELFLIMRPSGRSTYEVTGNSFIIRLKTSIKYIFKMLLIRSFLFYIFYLIFSLVYYLYF